MRKWVPVLAALVVLSAIALLAGGARGGQKATGKLLVASQAPEKVPQPLQEKIMTITLLQDGKPVAQTENQWGSEMSWDAAWDVEPGTYELRVEGEGAQTIVKRGIFVAEGRETVVRVLAEVGTGCKVITYGTAELGRFGKSCSADSSHLNASPQEWQFCPVCGKKLQ